jgi:hypothetical protein
MSRVLIGNTLVEICGKLLRAGEGSDARLRPAAAFGDAAGSLQALSACSACAGNYEDPDRTAWMPDVESADEVEELGDSAVSRVGDSVDSLNDGHAISDKFPAKEE